MATISGAASMSQLNELQFASGQPQHSARGPSTKQIDRSINASAYVPSASKNDRLSSGSSSIQLAANRVKVAVRCRPPFEEEGTVSAVHIGAAAKEGQYPKTLQLDVQEKRREFSFDVVFGPEATNTAVYDVVSGPVVDSVMKGINGTVMAYGQTGSGKTHSLGILTRVTGESGIIPRSLSHIFGYVAAAGAANAVGSATGLDKGTSYTITLSFLQLYLDAVQDLLTPAWQTGQGQGHSRQSLGGSDASMLNLSSASISNGGGMNTSFANLSLAAGAKDGGAQGSAKGMANGGHPSGPATLNVREDPARGFYVEGATEFTVTSFADALTLLNHGLENRVLGATRMNATSSRSHTMLLVKVEAKQPVTLAGDPRMGSASAGSATGFITRRSQLVLCDLAGSERVRRTSSRGARLEEARAINASLHTLGQVISALAVVSQQTAAGHTGGPKVHVPWRDSKLTRLLYGNLGGSANTYLLATMGPSPRNASETLSTLSFASRCMRVSSSPVTQFGSTQMDYAHLCTRLQARLAGIEAVHAGELGALARRYEGALADARAQLDASQKQATDAEQAAAAASAGAHRTTSATEASLESFSVSLLEGGSETFPGSPSALKAVYAELCRAYDASAHAILCNSARYARQERAWTAAIKRAALEEGASTEAKAAMAGEDPLTQGQGPGGAGRPSLSNGRGFGDGTVAPALALPDPASFGPHLGADYRSAAVALQAVHSQHNSNSVGRPIGLDTQRSGPVRSLLRPPAVPTGVAMGQKTKRPGGVGSGNNGSHPAADEDKDAEDDAGRSVEAYMHPPFESFTTIAALVVQCGCLSVAAAENCRRLDELCSVKDARFDDTKRHLAAAEAGVRVRDEDVQNQRYVLKYLVDTTAQLREELSLARQKATGGGGGGGAGAMPHRLQAKARSSQRPRQRASSGNDGAGQGTIDGAPLSPIALDGSPSSITSAPAFMNIARIVPGGVGGGSDARSGGRVFEQAELAVLSARLDLDMSGDEDDLVLEEDEDGHEQDQHGPPSISIKLFDNHVPTGGSAAPSGAPALAVTGKPPRPPLKAGAMATTGQYDEPQSADAGSSAASGPSPDEDEVERLVAHRVVAGPNGGPRMLYKVRWRGASPAEDEWFPREDLVADFPSAVAAYEAALKASTLS